MKNPESKNSFLIKAFVLAGVMHFVLLFLVTATLPSPTVAIKPNFIFLGSLFKSKDIFDSLVQEPLAAMENSKPSFDFVVTASDKNHNFSLDKPQTVPMKNLRTETSKTTFAIQEEKKKELSDDEFSPSEKFSLKPLRLERP